MDYLDASAGCSSCGGGNLSLPARVTYPTFTKEFAYDSMGRKTAETDVLSETERSTTHYVYDQAGALVSVTDANGKTTSYEYDALGRKTKETNALGNETQYAYDARGNLVALTDANHHTTTFEYDKNNRLKKETRPLGQFTTYTYDPAGRLINKVDSKGQKSEHVYDAAGQLIENRYYAADSPISDNIVTFPYDAAGNLLGYDDQVTSATYSYDLLGEKLSETVDYGEFSLTNSYEYFADGQKKSFTNPEGIKYSYAYDPADNLASIDIPGQGTIQYGPYTWTQPTRVTYPGGTVRELVYDPMQRVTAIESKAPDASTIMSHTYVRDPIGNVMEKQTEHGNYSYTYDDTYQLTAAVNPTPLTNESFTYDPVGNRLTAKAGAESYTVNANNELLEAGNTLFAYDPNGSQILRQSPDKTLHLFYNLENRLERVEDASGAVVAQYYYDPFGRRLMKQADGTTTYFTYTEEGLVAETNTAGTIEKTYGWRPNGLWGTDPVWLSQSGEYYLYDNDQLGAPQKLTDTDGVVVNNTLYTSFGYPNNMVMAFVNNLGYPGQYFDQDVEMSYNHSRYYDFNSGSYISVDPIFNDKGINYQYANNSPINIFDNLGRSPLDVAKIYNVFVQTVKFMTDTGLRLKNPWKNNLEISLNNGKYLGCGEQWQFLKLELAKIKSLLSG